MKEILKALTTQYHNKKNKFKIQIPNPLVGQGRLENQLMADVGI